MSGREAAKNYEGFPCYWCGVMTSQLNAERFHVCKFCAMDERKLSQAAMNSKYPNHGTDERNLEYFVHFREIHSGNGGYLIHGE